MDAAKKNRILYWVFTLLLGLPMFAGGFFYVFPPEGVVAGMVKLGYPPYLLKILGTAKMLGVLAIVVGRFRTLKEWAYAGFTFNFIGATATHVFVGDAIGTTTLPLVFLAFTFLSYYFWKKTT